MKKVLSLLFLASVIFVLSCGKDDDGGDPNCVTSDLTYTNSIKAILDTNCAISGCHSETEATLQGSMHNYAFAKAFADFGRVGGAINHEDMFKPMPKVTPGGEEATKLNDCTIDKIEAWIADGAPE